MEDKSPLKGRGQSHVINFKFLAPMISLEWLKLESSNFAWLSSYRYCVYHAQNLPGPAPDNILRVLHISSKSVRFRRSYS